MEAAYLFPLLVVGCVDIALIILVMTLFILPFTCASRWYPNEPAPRIVQLGFPSLQVLPFSMFVVNTVIQPRWYVSSISEYGGARGSSAAKLLALATSAAGCLQFVLAIFIWQYTQYAYGSDYYALARFILLSIGSCGCIMIGFAESAILWKYGQMEQTRLLWVEMTNTQRIHAIRNAIAAYENMLSLDTASQTDSVNVKLVLHPAWQQAMQKSLAEKTSTPTRDPILSSALHVYQALNLPEQTTQELRAVLKLTDIKAYLNQLQALLATKESGLNHVSGIATVSFQDPILQDTPPAAYMAFVKYETDGQDILIRGASPELILENDAQEKGLYSTIHVVSALVLIVANFAANILDVDLYFFPARYGSVILSIIGLTAFIAFCLMQYLSGNYDDSLPFPSNWFPYLTTESSSCFLHCCRCPQMQPKQYKSCSKKTLSLLFISVEIVAFLSIIMSIPIEAIMLSYYP